MHVKRVKSTYLITVPLWLNFLVIFSHKVQKYPDLWFVVRFCQSRIFIRIWSNIQFHTFRTFLLRNYIKYLFFSKMLRFFSRNSYLTQNFLLSSQYSSIFLGNFLFPIYSNVIVRIYLYTVSFSYIWSHTTNKAYYLKCIQSSPRVISKSCRHIKLNVSKQNWSSIKDRLISFILCDLNHFRRTKKVCKTFIILNLNR